MATRKLSISIKIWLSIAILLFGYCISIFFDFYWGHQAASQLYLVSDNIFPGSKLSQTALSTFDEMILLFRDYIFSGDPDYLDEAETKCKDVNDALLSIIRLKGDPLNNKRRIATAILEISQFHLASKAIYQKLAKTGFVDNPLDASQDILHQNVIELSEKKIYLRERIAKIETEFSTELKKDINRVSHKTKARQQMNIILFVIVVLCSLTLIAIIISRSVNRPLKKTFMLEKAVEQSPDGIAVTDITGVLQFANQAWARMHGYETFKHIINTHINTFMTHYHYHTIYTPQIDSIDTTGSFKDEMEHKRLDGSVFPCTITVNLLIEGNSPKRIVTIARDITMQKAAEKALQERTEQLKVTLTQVEDANKKIMDSIQYAQTIQRSLLPDLNYVKTFLPDHFIIWEPRDLVGGDIYLIEKNKSGILIAVIDCTGHGVPGAFMTMIASSSLRRIIKERGYSDPAAILRRLNYAVKTSLQQERQHVHSDDGLDAGICFIDVAHTYLDFAGANLPLAYIKKDTLQIIKGDRKSIGYKKSEFDYTFTNHRISIENGMLVYIFSDGFIDQLGGERHRRFGNKRLRSLLMKNYHLPVLQQREKLWEALTAYQGNYERQDDIVLIGFNASSKKES